MYSKLATGRLPTQHEWDSLVEDMHAALGGPRRAAPPADGDAAPAAAAAAA